MNEVDNYFYKFIHINNYKFSMVPLNTTLRFLSFFSLQGYKDNSYVYLVLRLLQDKQKNTYTKL